MCGTHNLIPCGVIQADPLGGLGGAELGFVAGFDEVGVTQGTGCLSVGLVRQVDAGPNPAVLCSSSDLRHKTTFGKDTSVSNNSPHISLGNSKTEKSEYMNG